MIPPEAEVSKTPLVKPSNQSNDKGEDSIETVESVIIETKSDQTSSFSEDATGEKSHISSGDSQSMSLSEPKNTGPGPKTGKICKNTWLGIKCQIQDCT